MNTYNNLIQHLKTTFEEDERVGSVVTGDFEEWGRDFFSVVHINVIDSPFVSNNTSNVGFNIEVNVLDIRDVNNQDEEDRFWHNDNRQDIWNETLSILNIARNKIVKDHLHNNITLDTANNATRISYAFKNGLDGWVQTWTISVPDNFTSIC